MDIQHIPYIWSTRNITFNSIRFSHDDIIVPYYVEGITLPNSRNSHGGITITSALEEMPLPNSTNRVMSV
jgi:hypothetical protein